MKPLVLLSSLAPGGAEQVTVEFLRFLAETGRPVPICTLTDRHDDTPALELSAAGVGRYDLGAHRLLDPLALGRLLSLTRREGFDLVHAHGQDAAIMGSAARQFSPFRMVVTRHVLEEPTDTMRQRLRAHLALDALRRADAPVSVSRAAADRLADLASIPPARIRVIRNGIALQRFDPARISGSGAEIREGLGIGPEDPLVLVPAVLRPGKGHSILLAAVPLVLERAPRACFALAGGGEMEGELRAIAERMGKAIRFLGHRSDVPELMTASDLVVLPSLAEALPTVAMEAAAAGRAMVASNVGGVPEVVEDGLTGVLVPPADPRHLADAVSALLMNREGRIAMGLRARKRALEQFGIEAQVRDTLRLWREVARNGGKPA
jgi:glycosyltransferase involved in cell wall biosynthesis